MLEARGISVAFGGVQALAGVSIEVDGDETLGLIGPNGSGKTTLLNALTGVVAARGAVLVRGQELALGHPERARRAGLVRMFQTPQTFTDLSVMENVLLSDPDHAGCGLGGSWVARPRMWRAERHRWERACRALELVGLGARAEQPSAELTFGEQRLLELARGIAAQPLLLMLDEPSAGLNDEETRGLARLIGRIRDEGVAVLVIDHKIDFIDGICDRIVVLELGRLIAQGTPAEVWSDRRVVDAYLGVADDA